MSDKHSQWSDSGPIKRQTLGLDFFFLQMKNHSISTVHSVSDYGPFCIGSLLKAQRTQGLSALIKVTALKSYLKLINISALKSPKDDYSWQWRLLKLWILIPSPFFFSPLFQGIESHCGDRCIEVSPQWPIWSLIRNQKVNNLFKIRTSSSWVQLDSKNAPRHTPYVLNPSNLSLVKC